MGILIDFVDKGNDLAISKLLKCVEDERQDVRQLVLTTLPKLTSKGDASTLAQVAQLCEHQCPKVRVVATRVLPGVLNIGDLRAIPLLVSRLEDSNKQVRLC